MKLSHDGERDALLAVQRDPDAHLVYAVPPIAGLYPYVRLDGALVVHRDGVQELLHRRLFRLTVDPGLGRGRLQRTCEQWGCANPHHYRRALGLAPNSKSHCPNGHSYERNTTPSGHCAICAARRHAARIARRAQPDAAGLNALKTHCPALHEYDDENTYLRITPTGEQRVCRACGRERAAARRRAA